MESLLGLPQAASSHAASIDQMLSWIHWLIIILFVGWGAYFIYVLFRFRAGRNPRADYRGAKTRASSYVEIGVALAEVILLVGFSIPLWSQRVDAFPDPDDAVTVRIIAEQFAWNVHYPGADGVFGRTDVGLVDVDLNPLGLDRSDDNSADDIVTLNQLHLPVNKPALIYLSSKDVIHSFALPEMRVKQDAIPGISVPLWFVPTMTTVQIRNRKGDPQFNYEIACAQLCGIGHYRMRGFMTVFSQDEFQEWMAQQDTFGAGGEDDFWNQ
jgi:cytochrome c oxidase subunit 2